MFLKASQSSSATDPLPLTLISLFPKSFKCVIITPIIKKSSFDPYELNHYRPISNLYIFSKTLERIVSTQLTTYLSTNNILNKYQSAFCPDKSCETTITSLTSNILSTLDKLGTLVVLLDLSTAFDTLNHSILTWDYAILLAITSSITPRFIILSNSSLTRICKCIGTGRGTLILNTNFVF